MLDIHNDEIGAAGACACSGETGVLGEAVDSLRQGGTFSAPVLRVTFDSMTSNRGDSATPARNFELMNDKMQATVMDVLELVSEIIPITFEDAATTTASGADVVFRMADINVKGYGTFPNQMRGSDVTISKRFNDYFENGKSHSTSLSPGDYGHHVIMHEIGHSILGLTHPHSGNFNLPKELDTQNATVMSYNSSSVVATGGLAAGLGNVNGMASETFQIFDIYAAQWIYGKNMNTRVDASEYILDGSKYVGTRWDAGSIDLLNSSSFDGDVVLDLREGVSNVSKVGESFTWNAFGSSIENIKSGLGADELYGNDLDNSLDGGNGDDELTGFAGNDTLDGGDGQDTVVFSGSFFDYTLTETSAFGLDGDDILISIEVLRFEDGEYTYDDEVEEWIPKTIEITEPEIIIENDPVIEVIETPPTPIEPPAQPPKAVAGSSSPPPTPPTPTPSSGGSRVVEKPTPTIVEHSPIVISGNKFHSTNSDLTNNKVFGTNGGDDFRTGGGDDFVRSSGGDDIISTNKGNDTIYSGSGNDLVHAGKGQDFLQGNSGDDELYSDRGSDIIRGGKGEDKLYGSFGNDILFGDMGSDTLTGGAGADSFHFNAKQGFDGGADFITDFEQGMDVISINAATKTATQYIADIVIHDNSSHIGLENGNVIVVMGVSNLTVDDFGF